MKSNYEVRSECFTVKAQKVLSEEEVAKIFKVKPDVIKETVERFSERFPRGYAYKVKTKRGPEIVFTEKGMYMLSAVLKSPVATEKCFAMVESYSVLMDFADAMNGALRHIKGGLYKEEKGHKKLVCCSDDPDEEPQVYDVNSEVEVFGNENAGEDSEEYEKEGDDDANGEDGQKGGEE